MQITIECDFDRINDMLVTAGRQAAIIRGARAKRERHGLGISPRIEEDLRNMTRIVALLRGLRNRIGNPYLEELKR